MAGQTWPPRASVTVQGHLTDEAAAWLQQLLAPTAEQRRARRSISRWTLWAAVPVDRRMLTDHPMRRAMQPHLEAQLAAILHRQPGWRHGGTYSDVHRLGPADLQLRGNPDPRGWWAWLGQEWRP